MPVWVLASSICRALKGTLTRENAQDERHYQRPELGPAVLNTQPASLDTPRGAHPRVPWCSGGAPPLAAGSLFALRFGAN